MKCGGTSCGGHTRTIMGRTSHEPSCGEHHTRTVMRGTSHMNRHIGNVTHESSCVERHIENHPKEKIIQIHTAHHTPLDAPPANQYILS